VSEATRCNLMFKYGSILNSPHNLIYTGWLHFLI